MFILIDIIKMYNPVGDDNKVIWLIHEKIASVAVAVSQKMKRMYLTFSIKW